jgi:spore germination protein KC
VQKVKLPKLVFVALLLMVLITTGCGSQNEPDEVSYVLLLGIDHGTNNLLRVSYMIAIPKALAGGGGEGGGTAPSSEVITVEAPSLYASMNMINTFIGRRVSLMHTKGLIFSQAMAEDGGMGKLVPALLQFRETRGTSFVAVSKESPEEILKEMKPFLENNPAKYIELLATNNSFTGFIPPEKLQDFYNELKTEGINPLCIFMAKSDEKLPSHTTQGEYQTEGSYHAGEMTKKGGVALEAMGAAAFRKGQMVGLLNGDETTLYSMIRGQFHEGIFSMPDPLKPDTVLAMDVFQARKPKTRIRLEEGQVFINIQLSLEGNLLGNTSLINYGFPEHRPVLEKAFAEKIKKDAQALVSKTQEEFKSDIFGFGVKAKRLFLTESQWRELNWPDLYQNAEVKIDVTYQLRRTGTLLRVMPVPKS